METQVCQYTYICHFKFLFRIAWIGMILFEDDRFTCPALQSPSAVPGRGRRWPGSVCCWGEWRTEWCPPPRWALLCWWPEDTMMGETVIYLCDLSRSAAYMPAVSAQTHSTTSLSPVTYLWNALSFYLRLLILRTPPSRVALSKYLSPVHLSPCDCLLNVQRWLNEPGLSMGATKQQHDGVFPLDCIHMVWFAAWQKESRGVH